MTPEEYTELVHQKARAWRLGHFAEVARIERALLGVDNGA